MKRNAWIVCIVLALAAVAYAQPPGHSSAYGKTLGEWMVGWFEGQFGASDGDGDGKVVYLKFPAFEDYTIDTDTWTAYSELDQTLEPGTAFAYPIRLAYGEVYEDGTEDDPDDPLWSPDAIMDVELLVTVDGETLIDSAEDDLEDWFFGPEYFDETIEYDEPTGYGAVGAVWVQGLGFVHTPLSKGDHVVHIVLYIPAWELTYDETWNITVAK